MKFEYFVDQPNLAIKRGITVRADTELSYKSDKVEQVLRDLKLDTILDDEGTNGINTYKSKSHIEITLNDGDILLFDESRGYYLPPYPKSAIEDAISDITSLRCVKLADEESTSECSASKE